MQEEQVRASAADQEKRLRRIEEDAAASERRAAIIRSDAETQANRIVRLLLAANQCLGIASWRALQLVIVPCVACLTHPSVRGIGMGVCMSVTACIIGAWREVRGWVQLASARAEQERLEAEARRMRDSAHEQQLSVMRQSLTASKVRPPPRSVQSGL